MILKEHKDKTGKTIIAVCDTKLIGQKITENKKVLDLSSEFYNGTEINSKDVGDIIRNADSINLVGPNSIKLGLDEELIEKKDIKYIDEIPYVEILIIHE